MEYLSNQLIAYIGNKRKLLTLIEQAINSIYKSDISGLKFLDIFAGSGSVSRLAKSMNLEVFTNDWEDYSYIINRCHIGIDKSELDNIFSAEGGIEKELERLNNLSNPEKKDEYIAQYYAPKSFDIDDVDYNSERLFYTRSNALIIDKIRNEIEYKYPVTDVNNIKKRDILISILLYEAATHTNTSGVFKAFHKGFGGHNKDALKRIIMPITMKLPLLVDSNYPTHIYKNDANDLVKKDELQDLDIAYLDPPYNQHQYGSNYHLLNTIAKWDKIPMPLDRKENGKLIKKSGIREDWVNTKSLYCYKSTATKQFKDLLSNISAKKILISYSTDGIIPFETMKNICSEKGRISLVTNEYTKYRGGRQSNKCENQNIEFIIIIETDKVSSAKDINSFDKTIALNKLNLLFNKSYSSDRLYKEFKLYNNDIHCKIGKKDICINTQNYYKILKPNSLNRYSLTVIKKLTEKLNLCLCKSKEEEIREMLKILEKDPETALLYAQELPASLRKLVHKKYADIYFELLDRIKNLEIENNSTSIKMNKKIEAIEILANKRFSG